MTQIWVERRKWPDLPHYGHAGWILGEDEHGLWIELRVGTPIYRGEEVVFVGSGGGLMCAPEHGRWLTWFPQHGDFELYIDVVCDMERTPESVTMIDMDLDIVRTRAGEVMLLDEDEFELHQAKYGYSVTMIEEAVRTATELLEAVRGGVAPFDGVAAARWQASITTR